MFSGTKKSPGTNHDPTTQRLFSENTSDRHRRPERETRDVAQRVVASGWPRRSSTTNGQREHGAPVIGHAS